MIWVASFQVKMLLVSQDNDSQRHKLLSAKEKLKGLKTLCLLSPSFQGLFIYERI